MSDIFEQDIEESEEDISKLEDADFKAYMDSKPNEHFVYPKILYLARLEYSCEGVYVTSEREELKKNDRVIIQTRYGKDMASILGKTKNPIGLKPSEIIRVERKASKEDLEKFKALAEREDEAFKIFKEKVLEHNLDMKLVAVHFLLEESKALFFFSSENRVDFRELVKDLVSVLKMRIELRQIGVRDESRIIGGLGVCGRPYCCHSIRDKLPPVSIKMAKEQNLSLNSTKISGQCGRLLCCLSYEYNWYAEAHKNLPNEGLHLRYDGSDFKIIDVNPIKRIVRMLSEDGRLLEIPASRFFKESGKWKID